MSGEVCMVSKIEDCKQIVEGGLYHVLIKAPDYNVKTLIFYH